MSECPTAVGAGQGGIFVPKDKPSTIPLPEPHTTTPSLFYLKAPSPTHRPQNANL